jgi:hypothetical protein
MPPRIVTARSIGLEFVANKLATMGPEKSVVGHYSGDPRVPASLEETIKLVKSFHHDHQVNRGWAGIGYHYVISPQGAIIGCRSTFHRGAHVLNNNHGRIGVNMPGTFTASIKTRPTLAQARAFNWLLHNAHTDAMPRVHRTDINLSTLPRLGHKDLMATGCPGLFHGMYMKGGEPWVEPSGDEEPDVSPADLTPEDEQALSEAERGRIPDPKTDEEATGPDDDERDAPEGERELPEPDDEFDEDLSAVLRESETEPARG